MNAPLSPLAEAVAILVEPFADLGAASGPLELIVAREVLHAAVHGLNVSSNLCKLIAELILLNFDAAGVSARHRDSSLEVRLIVDVGHHGSWLEEEVRALEA